MPRFRTILHLVTALLLTLQMARGSVDAILCLHSENAHLAFAHPESCGDAYADDANADGVPAVAHDDCACLDIPLPGHDHATSTPAPARATSGAPVLALPEAAAAIKLIKAELAPPPSPLSPDSLRPLLRRSVELRI